MTIRKIFLRIDLLVLICGTLYSSVSYSQQLFQSGLYMQDPYLINPAFAGIYNYMSTSLDIRRQWSNLNGAPESQYFSLSMPLYKLRSGIGLNVSREVLGASRLFNGDVSYNYIIPGTGNMLLSVAGGVGVRSNRLDGEILRTSDGEYLGNVINHNDPGLSSVVMNSNNMVFQVGIVMRYGPLEAALGASQLFATRLGSNDYFSYTPDNHLNLFASYFRSINENWSLSPSLLLKYDFATVQSDLDVLVYNRTLFGGLGFRGYSARSVDGLKFILGGKVTPTLLVAYNYELLLSDLNQSNNNTHELMLVYRIHNDSFKPKTPQIIFHPRM